jgi:hypothetical protein
MCRKEERRKRQRIEEKLGGKKRRNKRPRVYKQRNGGTARAGQLMKTENVDANVK